MVLSDADINMKQRRSDTDYIYNFCERQNKIIICFSLVPKKKPIAY